MALLLQHCRCRSQSMGWTHANREAFGAKRQAPAARHFAAEEVVRNQDAAT